jgi:hypothetical protein
MVQSKMSKTLILMICGGLFVFSALQVAASKQTANPQEPPFPCESRAFFAQDAGKPAADVLSPDKQRRVKLDDASTFSVAVRGRTLKTLKYYEMNSNIYVGWSPDSSQFFIMYSNGNWQVHVFALEGEQVRELALPKSAFDDFKKGHSCATRDNSILFLSWTEDSQKLFLVTEVHPTSDCGTEAGRFQGYLMQVRTGEILRRFNEKETMEIEKQCRASKTLRLSN